jgi:hypothetical protein
MPRAARCRGRAQRGLPKNRCSAQAGQLDTLTWNAAEGCATTRTPSRRTYRRDDVRRSRGPARRVAGVGQRFSPTLAPDRGPCQFRSHRREKVCAPAAQDRARPSDEQAEDPDQKAPDSQVLESIEKKGTMDSLDSPQLQSRPSVRPSL